jgi:anti-anti-sigma regulatory factor
LRSDTTHDLKDELMALTTLGMNLTVDLAGVEHISAASQHVLLDVQKKMDTLGRGTLLLQQLSQTIMDEFEKTGLSELLDIE